MLTAEFLDVFGHLGSSHTKNLSYVWGCLRVGLVFVWKAHQLLLGYLKLKLFAQSHDINYSNMNDLHTVVEFQVFLSNINMVLHNSISHLFTQSN